MAASTAPLTIDRAGLQQIIETLIDDGRRVIGPALRDGVIVYDDLRSVDDLPKGWGDEQAPGRYRVSRRDDDALFGYGVGPHSWKRFLFPPRLRLWQARRTSDSLEFELDPEDDTAFAFLGVRACELQAMGIQDRVFLDGPYRDAHYAAARAGAFIVAVNCGSPAATCFCASMGSGPRAAGGYDLALTEVLGQDRSSFLVEVGSDAGSRLMERVNAEAATTQEVAAAMAVTDRAAQAMTRSMAPAGLRDLLADSYDHPRWENVAGRCLTCGNCTMVCPTCFCTSVEDTADLTGDHAERWRRWDSCFTADFSYVHGGSVRASGASRYRQWLTHKLGAWHDQFGSSGCVGCGRCIAWCPVGIDLIEEVRALGGAAVHREIHGTP
ncbi:MAG: 4Fe-4S dicluster domain-containing protein [Chloroflexota bacterium]